MLLHLGNTFIIPVSLYAPCVCARVCVFKQHKQLTIRLKVVGVSQYILITNSNCMVCMAFWKFGTTYNFKVSACSRSVFYFMANRLIIEPR